jgi:hypothetical protein
MRNNGIFMNASVCSFYEWLERASTLQTRKLDTVGPKYVHKLVRVTVKLCRRIKHEVNFAGRIAWLKVTP